VSSEPSVGGDDCVRFSGRASEPHFRTGSASRNALKIIEYSGMTAKAGIEEREDGTSSRRVVASVAA
jgi:hypothetical protein